jgi:hypothetical protein
VQEALTTKAELSDGPRRAIEKAITSSVLQLIVAKAKGQMANLWMSTNNQISTTET